jgi:uncharacterized protein YjbJ (UPF0337 family)
MTKAQIEGGVNEVVGAVQNAAGKLLDQDSWKAEGKLREVAGKAQQVYGDTRDQLTTAVETQPFTALILAAAVGYALAVLTRR